MRFKRGPDGAHVYARLSIQCGHVTARLNDAVMLTAPVACPAFGKGRYLGNVLQL